VTLITFLYLLQKKTRIHVTPKATGKTEALIYETDDLFTFHHINAYEENGFIIMDVAAYDSGKVEEFSKFNIFF